MTLLYFTEKCRKSKKTTKVVVYDYTNSKVCVIIIATIYLEGLNMTNLKSNIDHYMKQKGIRMYSHLLVDIAHELGIKGQHAYL